MNDTPGWASPGSAPSDDQEAGVPRPSEPVDGSGPAGNWSSTQPPAGQWSAPGDSTTGPGTPPPYPGWGVPPQGPGWGRQPAAAKPGVIPLRPLGVGEILDGAVSTMRAHWRTVLGITLTVSVIAQAGILLVQRYLLPDPRRSTATPPARRPCARPPTRSAPACSTPRHLCSSRCSPRSSPPLC